MGDKIKRKRQRLVQDSGEKKSRYKLYKAGTKWVVAGVTTVAFTMGLMTYTGSTVASADSTDAETNAVSNTGDASLLDASSQTLQTTSTAPTSNEINDTNASGTNAVSTDDNVSETPSTPSETVPATGQDTINTEQTENATQEVADTTAATNDNSQNTTNAVKPGYNLGSAKSDVQPESTKASTLIAGAVTTGDTETDVTGVGKKGTDQYEALKDVSGPTLTGTTNSNKTQTPALQTTDGGIAYVMGSYPDVRTDMTPEIQTEAQLEANRLVQANPTLVTDNTDYTVTATHTRVINGVVTLTSQSVVTVTMKAQAFSYEKGTSPSAFQVHAYAIGKDGKTYTAQPSSQDYTTLVPGAITKTNYIGSSISSNADGTFTTNYDLTQKLSTSDYDTQNTALDASIAPENITGYVINLYDDMNTSKTYTTTDGKTHQTRAWINFVMNVLPFTHIQLTPALVDWQPQNSLLMNGTGTAVGDTVTIKSDDGTKSATATVDENGYWTADLATAGFTKTDAIYVTESNDLGDTPGTTVVPQYATATRTITYKDAITGAEIATKTTDPMTLINSGDVTTTTDTATPTVNRSAWLNSADQSPAEFSAISADDLDLSGITGYVAQDGVSSIAAVANGAVNQVVYLYPTTLTVDSEAKTDTTTTITPKDSTTSVNMNDSNSPKYPTGISQTDLTKPVTETVHYVNGIDGSSLGDGDTTQTVNYVRTATLNFGKGTDGQLTTTVKYGAWTPATGQVSQFDAVSRDITDYTELNTIPAITLDNTDDANIADFDKTIYYVPTADLTHIVKVSTVYNVPAGQTAKAPETADVTFYRTYALNEATGKVEASPWTTNDTGTSTSTADQSATLPAITDDKQIAGYDLSSSTTVDGKAVTDAVFTGDNDTVVRTVDYTNNQMTVNYVNEDGKTIHTDTVKAGEYTTDPSQYAQQVTLPDGTTSWNYQLVPDQADLNTESGTLNQGADPTTNIETFTGEAGKTYTIEVAAVHVLSTQQATWTIHYQYADGTKAADDATQHADWQEDINVAAYGADSTDPTAIIYTQQGKYTDQVSPVIPQFTADKLVVPASEFDSNEETEIVTPAPVTVVYTRTTFDAKNPGSYNVTTFSTRTITYETVDGATVSPDQKQTTNFTRTYDATTKTYSAWVPDNSEFSAVTTPQLTATVNGKSYFTTQVTVPSMTVPTPSSDANGEGQNFSAAVTYYPTTVTVTPTMPKDEGNLTNGTGSPAYPAGVAINDLNKTLTETVHYVNPTEPTKVPADKTVQISFERSATITYTPQADGTYTTSIDYGDWTATDGAGKFKSVPTPAETGYLPDVQSTPEVTVTSAEVDNFTDPAPTVTYYPTQITVTPDQPKDQNTPTINGDTNSPLYPAGLTVDMLNKTITETINYVDDKGNVLRDPTSDQKVNFTRIATVTYDYGTDGKLTGTVVYNPWTVADSTTTDGVFAAVEAPVIAGYTAPAGQVGQVTKTGDDADFEKTITYFSNKDLTRTVPVTTHYDAYTAEGATDETPAQDVTDATVVFYRQPTYDAAGTYGFTDWTTNASGQSQATSDLTSNVAPIDATIPAGFHLLVKTTYTDAATGQTSTTTTTDPTATGVEVKSTYSAVARDVSYVQDYYNITFVDVNDPANPVTLGTTQQVGDPYEAGSTTVPDWGLLKIADTGTYLSEEGGTIDPDTGVETFTATPDGNYTIQLVHASEDNQTTTTRNVVYQLADGTSVAPSVAQKETWTGNTDLYISAKDSNIGVTPTTLYTQTSAYGAQDSPLTGTFTGKDGKTYDLSEYTPDIKTVAAATLQSVSTTATPSNAADVVVTYTRTTFTPENPGDYANQLTSTSTRTIHYVDGADQTKDELAPSVTQTVTFERNYNVTTGFSDWTVADESTTDGSTDGTYDEQGIPTIPGYVTTATSTPTEVAVQGTTPEDVDVTYYPTTVTVTPDAPKTTADHVTTDPNSPTYPEGVNENDLNRVVTETVHYVNAGTAIPDAHETVAFTRTATVTYTVQDGQYVGTPTPSDWVATNNDTTLDAITSPVVDGMVANRLTVPAVEGVKETDADSVQTVTYYPATVTVTVPSKEGDPSVPGDLDSPALPAGLTADKLTQQVNRTISFKDNLGNPIADDQVETISYLQSAIVTYDSTTGVASVKYNNDWAPIAVKDVTDSTAGKKVVAFEQESAPATITKDGTVYFTTDTTIPALTPAATDPDVAQTVVYYPATVTVTPNEDRQAGTHTVPSDDQSPKYPAGVTSNQLNVTIPQTVTYIDGVTKKPIQTATENTVNFTRTATVSYVDASGNVTLDSDGNPVGTVTYTDWTAVDGDNTFEQFDAPKIENYQPATPTVEAQVAQATDTDADALVDHDVTITYYPTSVTVHPTAPHDAGGDTVQGDDNSPKYPKGVSENDLNRTITQTVHYVSGVDGTTPVAGDEQVNERITFTRDATIDYSQLNDAGEPGKVTYTDWTAQPSTFESFTPKTITGYVTYTPTVSAKQASADDQPGADDVTVYYYPATVTVTPDQPKTSTDKTPGDDGAPMYPAGVAEDDLNKTVTETIHYVDGTNPTKTVHNDYTAQIAFSRTATVDYANLTAGKPTVTYGKWVANTLGTGSDAATQDESATFEEVTPDPVTGYLTPAPTAEQTVTADSPNVELTVKYYQAQITVTPNDPKSPTDTTPNNSNYPAGVSETDLNRTVTETIHYVDGTDPKKTVHDDYMSQIPFSRIATVDYANLTDGQPTVTYGKWVANDTGDGSDTAIKDGSTIFATVDSEPITGYLTPADTAEQTVTADSPNVELTVNYYPTRVQVPANGGHLEGYPINPDDTNSPTYPAGVSDSDLNQQAVETIRFLDDGNSAQLLEPVVQTLNLTRNATITYSDSGDPVVTYTDWTDGADNTFPMLVSPKIAGMTPKQANVPALVETDPAPVTATIYYVKDTGADAGTGTDTNGGGTNTTTTTPGTPTDAGETPTATPENPAGTLQTPETTPINQPQTPTGKAETPLANPVQKPVGKTETPVATPAPEPGATPVQQPVATPVNEPEAQPTPTSTKTTPTTQQPTTEAATETLPQTNDEQNATTSLLGLVGLSFLGMFGLGKKRKRED